MLKSKPLKYVALILFIVGLGFTGKAVYIHAKAGLAKYLLRSSWQETVEKGGKVKPWPWADTWPVARMIVPNHEIDLVVLEGDSGSVLAFGPGHMTLSSLPGQPGNSIISGHRDTSFNFLKDLDKNEVIQIQTPNGSVLSFKITDIRIIDIAALDIILESDRPYLTLVTCYPFDAIVPGGPQRYLVFAELDEITSENITKKDLRTETENFFSVL